MTAVRRPRRSWLWLQGALAGALAVAMPGEALIAGALFCLVITSYVVELTPGKPVSRIMLLAAIATSIQPAHVFWEHGATLDAALDILSDPARLLLVWSACGAGWLLSELAQLGSSLAINHRAKTSVAGLQHEAQRLREEWTFDDDTPTQPE